MTTWFMFGNFYIKSNYERMDIVWMIVIKITFEYKITKKDMNLYYIFYIILFDIIIYFFFILKYLNKFNSKKKAWINYVNIIFKIIE